MSTSYRIRMGLRAGVVAPLVYVAVVIAGGALVPGYSHITDPISALTATGRQGVRWIEAAFAVYNLLLLAFAVTGMTRLGGAWRPAFALLMGAAGAGLLMWPFPMDLPGTAVSLRGAIHIALVIAASVMIVAAVWFSLVSWRRIGQVEMSLFSAACLAAMAVFGLAAAIAAVQGWAAMGLLERGLIGAFELWLLVTAAVLVREATLAQRMQPGEAR